MSKTRNAGGGGIPPSNTVAPVISGSSTIGSTLSSTTGTWVGDPVITYSYQWKRAGVDIVGETNSTYVLVAADYNQAITCEVTATNAFGAASATSNSIIATATAPVNTVAPVISGTAVVGQTLSSTTGTWTGAPTPTYAYQWKRNGSNIASATSSTYTLVQADATFAITCAVTATNIAGSAEATSNSLTITDADAQSVITAIESTGVTLTTTQKNACNQLIVDLKGFGIWTKMKALYGFLGGTAGAHKWNWKDPQDTNAAFRLVFNGGWTHSVTGALPNGTNAYADSFLNTQTHLSLNSGHLSYYSRLNTISGSYIEIGSLRPTPDSYTAIIINGFGLGYLGRINNGGAYDNIANADSRGFYLTNRTASNIIKLQKNGTVVVNGTAASNATSNINIYLGAANNSGITQYYTNRECAFSSIGDGLTGTEAANFYTAVNAYQVALSRNV